MATSTTIEIAHKALPILIYHAQIGKTITYKALADAIGRHHRTLMYPLGYIRDAICVECNSCKWRQWDGGRELLAARN